MLTAFKDMQKISQDTYANNTHLLKVSDENNKQSLDNFESVMSSLSNKKPELRVTFCEHSKVGLVYKGDFKKHLQT